MKRNKKRQMPLPFLIGILILLSLVSAVLVLCLGAVRIPFEETFRLLRLLITGGEIPKDLRTVYRVVWLLRMPRVILGFAAGCGLALCGTVMQATVQNPMADPYILGISAGGTLGATASIFLGVKSPAFLHSPGQRLPASLFWPWHRRAARPRRPSWSYPAW